MSLKLKEENGGEMLMIGQNEWQKGMALFCKPFTTAKIRYCDRADADVARTRLDNDSGTDHDQ